MAGHNSKHSLVEHSVDTNQHANIITKPSQVILNVRIQGASKLLFHRYDCASVKVKGDAKKGSSDKKSDDLESYLYRDENNAVAVAAENIHACLAASAKSFQDPRSPRKSAMDLLKAGILVLPDLIPFTRDGETFEGWDFLDTRRVTIKQSAISRTRPGLEAGWELEFDVHILVPQLISVELFREVLQNAGAIVGLCDFRPRFGRFYVTACGLVELED
jgi:hypothetical protein